MVMLVAGLVAPAARAIEALRADPDLTDYHKAGPVYWQPALSLRDVGYDDNLFLTSDTSPATTTFTWTVAPTARLFAPIGERAAVRARGDLSYTSYARSGDQSFVGGGGAARADYYLTRWNLYVDADYMTTRVRPTDEFHLRPRRVDQGITFGARMVRSDRVSLHLYALQDDTTFRDVAQAGSTDFRARLDRNERAAGLGFAYRVGRMTDLTIESEARDYDFSEPDALTPLVRSRRMLAGLDWKPTSRVNARLRAGRMTFDADNLPGQSYDGATWSASLNVKLFSRLWAGLNGSRDVWLSAFENNLFAVSTRGALNLTTSFTPKAGAELGGEYYLARYSDVGAVPERRLDHASRVYVGGRYRFSDRLSASLRLTRFLRNSNIDGQDARENLVSASLDWLF